MLAEFGFGLLRIDLQELPDIAKLAGYELVDASDPGRHGIRLSAKKSAIDLIQLFLAAIDRPNHSWGVVAGGKIGNKILEFLFDFAGSFPHPPDLVAVAIKGGLQLPLEFLNGVVNDFRPAHGTAEFEQQASFR